MENNFKTKKSLTKDNICNDLSEEYYKEYYPNEYYEGVACILTDVIKREEQKHQFNKCVEGINNLCKMIESL